MTGDHVKTRTVYSHGLSWQRQVLVNHIRLKRRRRRRDAHNFDVLWDSHPDVLSRYRETSRAHIHADYQGKVAVYSILDGTLLAGELPPNKHKLVVAWIEIHQEDLVADWNLVVNGRKPFPIKGLDQ